MSFAQYSRKFLCNLHVIKSGHIRLMRLILFFHRVHRMKVTEVEWRNLISISLVSHAFQFVTFVIRPNRTEFEFVWEHHIRFRNGSKVIWTIWSDWLKKKKCRFEYKIRTKGKEKHFYSYTLGLLLLFWLGLCDDVWYV